MIVVESEAERIELAHRFGAHSIVDMKTLPTVESRLAEIQSIVDARGADVVLDVSGAPAAFVEVLQLVRPAGTDVEVANVNIGPDHEILLAPGLITRKSVRIRGVVHYHPWYLHKVKGVPLFVSASSGAGMAGCASRCCISRFVLCWACLSIVALGLGCASVMLSRSIASRSGPLKAATVACPS